jgi:hypothetical protein
MLSHLVLRGLTTPRHISLPDFPFQRFGTACKKKNRRAPPEIFGPYFVLSLGINPFNDHSSPLQDEIIDPGMGTVTLRERLSRQRH